MVHKAERKFALVGTGVNRKSQLACTEVGEKERKGNALGAFHGQDETVIRGCLI